jgi:hypothetical protein
MYECSESGSGLRIRMFLGLLDPHPDPLGMDPRIRIRTKTSRIFNTVYSKWSLCLRARKRNYFQFRVGISFELSFCLSLEQIGT